MNKELLKSVWKLFGLTILLLLFIVIYCRWLNGEQIDNFTLAMFLFLAISLKD
jgi:hypothetical protein